MKTLVLDTSMMKNIAMCSSKAYMSGVLGLRSAGLEPAPLAAGTAIHAALATFLGTGDVKRGRRKFRQLYKQRGLAEQQADPTSRYGLQNLQDILWEWFLRHRFVKEKDGGRVFAGLPFIFYEKLIEVPFIIKVPGPGNRDERVVLTGVLDALVKHQETKQWWVLDHKEQPVDAPVLTPDGWKPIGSLIVGDPIMAADGSVTTVTGVYPQGKRPVYELTFFDGAQVQCGKEHLWPIVDQAHAGRGYTIRTLQNILTSSRPIGQFGVPSCGPMQWPKKTLPLHPYLLGALLGNGCFTGTSVQFTTKSEEQMTLVRDVLPEGCCITQNKSSSLQRTLHWGRGNRNHIKTALTQLGLWGKRAREKFIPHIYLFSSVEDRLALLQGLMDTDGNIHKGYISFCSTSIQLRADVQHLVRSLGGAAGVLGAYHRTTFRLPPEYSPFLLSRKRGAVRERPWKSFTRYIKQVDQRPEREMVCITIAHPTHLYVTQDFIVTHNTSARLDKGWRESMHVDAQFSVYVLAAHQHIPGKVVNGAVVNGIETALLPRSTRRCSVHGTTYDKCRVQHVNDTLVYTERTPEECAHMYSTAGFLASRYTQYAYGGAQLETVPMEGRFIKDACRWCDFKPVCDMANRTRALRGLTAHHNWHPHPELPSPGKWTEQTIEV